MQSNTCVSQNIASCEPTVDMSYSVGQVKVSSFLLHQRLGHPSTQTLSLVIKNNNLYVSYDISSCVACAVGKSCKLPFSKSQTIYISPIELMEMDLWGSATVSSNGFLYYLSIVDVYTRYTWIYFLHSKSDIATIFPQFH